MPHLVRRLVARVRCRRGPVEGFTSPMNGLSPEGLRWWQYDVRNEGAWIRAASAAFWMMPRALSATPFSSGLFALVNSRFMQNCSHTSPNSPTKEFPSVVRPYIIYLRRHTIRTHISQKLSESFSSVGNYARESIPMSIW